MKKIITVVLAMAAGVMLVTGCGKEASSKETGKNGDAKYTIGLCSPNLDDKFQVYISDEITANADAQNIKTILVDAKEDTAKQLGQVENFIVQGVDAIICIPVDTNAAEPMVEAAKAAEIPFICVNREISHDDVTAYVGSSDFSAGELQAEILLEIAGEETKVGIIEGIPGHIAGVGRVEGFESGIEGHPGVKIDSMLSAMFQRSEAVDVMENWIKSGTDIQTVIACNDEMAIGASLAIESEGKTGDYIIIGVDGTKECLHEIKAGKVHGTCFQNPFAQGAKAVEVAVAAIEGKDFEAKNYIPFEKITEKNVDDYIKIWEDAEK